MTAEEKALEMYPDKDDLFNIGTEDNFTHNEIAFLERVAFRRGWNDRDSLVEAEKKDLINKIKAEIKKYEAPYKSQREAIERESAIIGMEIILDLLTP